MKKIRDLSKSELSSIVDGIVDDLIQAQKQQSANPLAECLMQRHGDIKALIDGGATITMLHKALNAKVECSRYELRAALVHLKLWPQGHRKNHGKKPLAQQLVENESAQKS